MTIIRKIATKLRTAANVLKVSSGWQTILRAKPRSLASFKVVNELRSEVSVCDTIIDGGANVGQFARAATTAFPDATIYSFEPLPDIADVYRKNLSNAPKVSVHQFALASIDGEVTFHRNSQSQSSSVLPMVAYQKDGIISQTQVLSSFTVAVRSLDSFFSNIDLTSNTILKLDLQGYELEALRGATETLKKCSHVVLEAVFKPVYESEPLFEEIWDYLRARDFKLLRPLTFLEENSGRIVQLDALFVRKKNSLLLKLYPQMTLLISRVAHENLASRLCKLCIHSPTSGVIGRSGS